MATENFVPPESEELKQNPQEPGEAEATVEQQVQEAQVEQQQLEMDPNQLMNRFISPEQQQNLQQGAQNVAAGAPSWIEQNIQTPLGAYLKGRTVEEEQAWRDKKKEEYAEQAAAFEEQTRGNPIRELFGAAVGGKMDAVDSLTGFGELVGDTAKKGLNDLLGKPTDPTQDPNSPEYIHREIGWLDIPEEWKPENHTGLGKFARGIYEFGFLTGGVHKASTPMRANMAVVPGFRSAQATIAGNRYLKFIDKGTRIFAEGAIAELITSSSESGNIINLAEEHVPWLVPDIVGALAVRPEDNPWLARIKTVTAGGGMNHVGHFIGAFAKGLWGARKHIEIELTPGRGRKWGDQLRDEADEIGNRIFREELDSNFKADEEAATTMAANNFAEGRGMGRADPRDEYLRRYLSEDDYKRAVDSTTDPADRQALEELADNTGKSQGDDWDELRYQSRLQRLQNRKVDPFVNPEQFDGVERATYRVAGKQPDAIARHIRQGIHNMKKGGQPMGSENIFGEPFIRAVSRGNKRWRELVDIAATRIANDAFRDIENRLDHAQVKALIMKQAEPMLEALDDFAAGKGGNLAKQFKEALDDPNNKRVYMDDGVAITTTSPSTKGANVLVLNALAQTVTDLADAAYHMSDKVAIQRQAEEVFDAMEVLMVESKKSGMMWGLDGKQHSTGFKLSPALKASSEQNIKIINQEMKELRAAQAKLMDEGRWDELRDLIDMYRLSKGHVRTMEGLNEFLRKKRVGGRMDDITIKGRRRQEIQGFFFNSILGGLKTIRKAIIGTNTIAMLRPFQAYIGARLPWVNLDEREIVIATAQIESMGRAWAESWAMAVRNWELGVNRKNADYRGKFDFEADMQDWKQLAPYVKKYSSPEEQQAYAFMDGLVNFNSSKWTRYSQNAMGAGDAFARTLIGRQMMAKKAALAAYDQGIDLKDIPAYAAKKEELFRKEIFNKNREGKWIVTDKAAAMAGDEAAMTTGLQNNFQGFEQIAKIPGMVHFFPFVRTGFNYLDVVFQHTYLNKFRDKYKDLVAEPRSHGAPPSEKILAKYGLKPNEVAQEVALMEGRMAMGTAIAGMATIGALSGTLTGDYPANKIDRDHWRNNKIQPRSFKFGNVYISHEQLEVFSPILTTIANIVGHNDILGGRTVEEEIGKMTWVISSLLVDQTMLGGVGDLAKLIDAETFSVSRVGSVLARTGRAQFLPGATISAELGQAISGAQMEANNIWEKIIQRDAAVNQMMLAPKYDIFSEDRSGKVLHYSTDQPLLRMFNFMSPFAITPADNNPVKQLLQEIRFNLPEALNEINGVELNSLERSELQRILATKGPYGEDLYKDLHYVMIGAGSGRFKRTLKEYKAKGLKVGAGYDLKDADFYTIVASVIDMHKERARRQMVIDNPDLAKRIAIQEEKDIYMKTGMDPGTLKRIERKEQSLWQKQLNNLLNMNK